MEVKMEEVIRAHVLVEGNVQGVGFRAFTQYQANLMNLHGWVRNRAGGGVELEVEGPKLTIEGFLQVMHQGPPLAKVTQVTVDWKEPNRQTEGFKILRSSL
jgi:acylphosphatase